MDFTEIIDISHTLSPSFAEWPGDSVFKRDWTARICAGSSVNLSRLCFSPHTGTHADSPYHYSDEGATLESMDLGAFLGDALVVNLRGAPGPICSEEFRRALERVDIPGEYTPRVLLRTGYEPANPFETRFRYPSESLIEDLGHGGALLLGTDAPSVDAFDSKKLPGHSACASNGIYILEFLDLRNAEEGRYTLIAPPPKIDGSDGSPVRALLIPRS